jgi:SNF2 family DNA or RNA helicase
MQRVTQFRFVPKPDATAKVFSVMQPAVRFTLDDVVELPELVERTVDIEMGEKQAKVYESLRQHAFAAVEKREITAANAGVVLNYLLQVSLGYVYAKRDDGTRAVVSLDNEVRLAALLDALASTDHKVLVFVPFIHALQGIEKKLKEEGIDVATVSGSTAKGERDRVFNLFQNTNQVRVIAAHPATMSHGLTLTAADTVIWFGPTTSLETFEQANARVRRIGQKHKQQVLMFQATAAEKKIYARLRSKQRVQDNLLEMFADHT